MAYPPDHHPTAPPRPPPGGLLRRAFQQAHPPVPPERWLTQDHAPRPSRSQSPVRRSVGSRQAPRVPSAPAATPAASTSPASRGRPSRWMLLGLVLALILAGIWAVAHRSAPTSTQAPPTSRATLGPNAPTSMTPSASASGTPSTAASTPSASAIKSIQQDSTQFLAAYFTWSASDSNDTYLSHWRPFVADAALRDLSQAAPRLSLDEGNDSAAASLAPAIPTSAVQISSQHAQVQVIWTIQVLPPGAELVQWQTRQIQATLSLVQNASGWQIVSVTWTSTGE